ncbi:MAG: DUF4320 family protein [Clostridium sp.]|nr:DUF4320 family protein [Clostridium sp.]
MKKKKGEVQQFFVQIICIIFSFVILLYSIYFLKQTLAYNHLNTVARKYILKMERQGCLTSKQLEEMKTEILKNNNIKSSSINITPEADCKVQYGEDVNIDISCEIIVTNIDLSSFNFEKSEDTCEVEVSKSSTARW